MKFIWNELCPCCEQNKKALLEIEIELDNLFMQAIELNNLLMQWMDEKLGEKMGNEGEIRKPESEISGHPI